MPADTPSGCARRHAARAATVSASGPPRPDRASSGTALTSMTGLSRLMFLDAEMRQAGRRQFKATPD